ncbi:MAG: amidohydrolase family protein [Candidatus Eremiobacteraeota bacterium]|nr:amidohydrolase family protein [Candidatus Eremiobacteraeota bacterium]MBV8371836.1 amidohydrolase family protein [Candidatus Eremiobacteraeota bacterium]
MQTVLGPAFIALGDGTSTFGRIAVEDGRIAAILAADGPTDDALHGVCSIAPGMIDVHTNGARDFLFNRDQGYAVPVAAVEYARMGATGFVAGIMTAPFESMLHAASEVVEAANQLEEDDPRGARCLGVHFEGPFLNPKFRRIHRAEWLLHASTGRAREMIDACKGACLLVTMAPEIEGASDALRVFLENAVVCSAGHTSARYSEGLLAIGLGFRSLTHAFNGMPPLDHRDPSILAAFIQDRRTLVQFICDGFHVSPVMVDLLHRTLGDRLVLATDNMPPADPGYHIEGGVVRAADGTIAGSALRMDEAVRNYMAYAQIPFAQAIVGATYAPAKLIQHDGEMGRIAPRMRADLSFWDKDYGIVGTMVGGRFVYNRTEVAA